MEFPNLHSGTCKESSLTMHSFRRAVDRYCKSDARTDTLFADQESSPSRPLGDHEQQGRGTLGTLSPMARCAHQTVSATSNGPRVILLSDSTASNSLTLKEESEGCAAKLVMGGLLIKA